MDRFFLAVVGIAYLMLAGWCCLLPLELSQAVGYELLPGLGESEFLAIYTGMDIALAVIFIWPVFRTNEVANALSICVIIHGSLATFRTLGFILYASFSPTTHFLAASEWIVFLVAVILRWRATPPISY